MSYHHTRPLLSGLTDKPKNFEFPNTKSFHQVLTNINTATMDTFSTRAQSNLILA